MVEYIQYIHAYLQVDYNLLIYIICTSLAVVKKQQWSQGTVDNDRGVRSELHIRNEHKLQNKGKSK